MNRKGLPTVDEAETIRREIGLSEEQFSVRIGWSARAYYQAKRRGRLSWWMAREIAMRFGKRLQEIRGE